uniref:Uncharacterized protein n=1 Tax=Physcomitrium patens TaxID=3218 RepID=A0A7I3ZFH8_PHYPA
MRDFQERKEAVNIWFVRLRINQADALFKPTLSPKSKNISEVKNSTITMLRSWPADLKPKGNSS